MNIPEQYQSKEKFKAFITDNYEDNFILLDMLEYFDDLTPLERQKETQCATLAWNKSLIGKTKDDRNLALWETKQKIIIAHKEQNEAVIQLRKHKENSSLIKSIIPIIIFSFIFYFLFKGN